MVSPKFSILNTFANSRVGEVRKQMELLKGDLKLAGLPDLKDDPVAKRDRYFASMPILIKGFFEFLEKEMVNNRPEIVWDSNDDFKVKFLETYNVFITELSSKYFRELGKQTFESLKKIDAGEITELSENERAYLSFVLDDPNPNGGVTVLSPVDGLYILSHIAGLIIDLGVNDSEKFKEIMGSRGVFIFTNSLMINESDGMSSLMGLLSQDHKTREHKSTTYSFSTDFFIISDGGNLILRKDILSVVRKVFENNREKIGEVDRRNCPASYAPKQTNEFFSRIIEELIIQYSKFLGSVNK